MQKQYIFLSVDNNSTTFSFEDKTITLPIGYKLIEDKFLKNTPPSYDEIEYAINYIEDEIEKVVSKFPSGILASKDQFIMILADFCGKKENDTLKIYKDDMEKLFGEYAEVSVGRVPSKSQTDLSPSFYAKLLILREYMHHVKYEYLEVLN